MSPLEMIWRAEKSFLHVSFPAQVNHADPARDLKNVMKTSNLILKEDLPRELNI